MISLLTCANLRRSEFKFEERQDQRQVNCNWDVNSLVSGVQKITIYTCQVVKITIWLVAKRQNDRLFLQGSKIIHCDNVPKSLAATEQYITIIDLYPNHEMTNLIWTNQRYLLITANDKIFPFWQMIGDFTTPD